MSQCEVPTSFMEYFSAGLLHGSKERKSAFPPSGSEGSDLSRGKIKIQSDQWQKIGEPPEIYNFYFAPHDEKTRFLVQVMAFMALFLFDCAFLEQFTTDGQVAIWGYAGEGWRGASHHFEIVGLENRWKYPSLVVLVAEWACCITFLWYGLESIGLLLKTILFTGVSTSKQTLCDNCDNLWIAPTREHNLQRLFEFLPMLAFEIQTCLISFALACGDFQFAK